MCFIFSMISIILQAYYTRKLKTGRKLHPKASLYRATCNLLWTKLGQHYMKESRCPINKSLQDVKTSKITFKD